MKTGWELRTEWDYMPRARIWLLTIDSPPSLLFLPFIALVAKFRLASQLVFLLAVGFFWYWFGSAADPFSFRCRPEKASFLPATGVTGH